MTTKIVTGLKPVLKTYLAPANIKQVDYFDGAKLTATLPRVESEVPREVTQILLSDGSMFYIFDSEVKSRRGECKLQLSNQMVESIPEEELDKWVEDRMRYENVPSEAAMTRHDSKAMMMTYIEWVWWEVSW